VALLIALLPAAAGAQSASEPTLKAAFLYNFAKLTEWPSDALPVNAPLQLCIAGDWRVAKALEETSKNRDVDGHPLLVRKMDLQGPIQSCHVLYADDLDAKRTAQLLDRLKGIPVLTVSDFDSFAQLGGAANLLIEDGRMRFAVNADAAQRNKLRLSSRLLSLAKMVKDDPNVR
jgi:hypothetical protein